MAGFPLKNDALTASAHGIFAASHALPAEDLVSTITAKAKTLTYVALSGNLPTVWLVVVMPVDWHLATHEETEHGRAWIPDD
jgi:hypothetical protein